MSDIHQVLLNVAKAGLTKQSGNKQAFVPMPAGQVPPDPAMMQGAPGAASMDPAMMQGAPGAAPMDPAAMQAMMAQGGAPMDPAMMQGAPMDPAMMAQGGMPMDPAMMQPPPGPQMDPAMLDAIRQVVQEEMAKNAPAQAPAEQAPTQPKSGGKAAMEERLTAIEQGLTKILGVLTGQGALPAQDIMPQVPPQEMGTPVEAAPPPQVETKAAEDTSGSLQDRLARALNKIRRETY